jgi:VWFA-related protein
MNRHSGLLFAAALLVSPLHAQQYTEKIDVSRVNVDVTVTSHGAPVRGLTRDDFEIFEDGTPQPITNFDAVESRPPAATATAPPSGDGVTAAADDERFRRKVLVIIDNRHVSMYNRDRALAQLERFVNDRFAGGYDWSIALVSDTAHLLLAPTSDKAKIHQAVAEVRKLMANPRRTAVEDISRVARVSAANLGETMSPGAREGDPERLGPSLQDLVEYANQFEIHMDAGRTVGALSRVVQSFATASGRKIVLLITGSLGIYDGVSPNDVSRSSTARAGEAARAMTAMRDVLIREANASNVSFYIVNCEGLEPDSTIEGASGIAASVGRPLSSGGPMAQLSSMYWVARETGGRLMPGNSVERSLREFDNVSSNFYSLAYRPSHPDDGEYHAISVRLKKSGRYSLQYRTGYSSFPLAVQLARTMESPLAASMQSSTIPIRIVTGEGTPENGSVRVPLHARVDAKGLQFVPSGDGSVARVDFFVSVFDERGRKVDGIRFMREARAAAGSESEVDFVESRMFMVKRGKPYRFVVAVHDQVTGAIGIASERVQF